MATDEKRTEKNNDANIFQRFQAWTKKMFGMEKPKEESHYNNAILEQLKYVDSEKTRDYIQNRVVSQIDYYRISSRESKANYHSLMTASIVLGAIIPVTAVFVNDKLPVKLLIAVLGGAVTAINAILSMQNYRDLWLTHRATRQELEHILYFYFNNVGIFEEGTQEEKDACLIDICEDELEQETSRWRSIMWKKSEHADKKDTA